MSQDGYVPGQIGQVVGFIGVTVDAGPMGIEESVDERGAAEAAARPLDGRDP